MINESNYSVRSKSGYGVLTSLQPNLGGFVHVETIFIMTSGVSTGLASDSSIYSLGNNIGTD